MPIHNSTSFSDSTAIVHLPGSAFDNVRVTLHGVRGELADCSFDFDSKGVTIPADCERIWIPAKHLYCGSNTTRIEVAAPNSRHTAPSCVFTVAAPAFPLLPAPKQPIALLPAVAPFRKSTYQPFKTFREIYAAEAAQVQAAPVCPVTMEAHKITLDSVDLWTDGGMSPTGMWASAPEFAIGSDQPPFPSAIVRIGDVRCFRAHYCDLKVNDIIVDCVPVYQHLTNGKTQPALKVSKRKVISLTPAKHGSYRLLFANVGSNFSDVTTVRDGNLPVYVEVQS